MRLSELLRQYAAQHDYGVAGTTLSQYRYALTSLKKHLGHDPTTADLTDSAITGWVDWLRDHRSPHTARTQRGSVLTLWRWAWMADVVDQPPKRVRKLRMPAPAPESWSAEDVARLIGQAEQVPSQFRGLSLSRSYHLVAFLRVAWDSGLRLGDVLRIKPVEVQPDGRLDVVQHKTRVRQTIRLWPETVAAIGETMADEPDRELIFPLAARRYQEWIARLARQCELRGSVKWIRRGVGTAAEVEGGYGSKMLGHTDQRTLRFYLDRSAIEPAVAPRIPVVAARMTAALATNG